MHVIPLKVISGVLAAGLLAGCASHAPISYTTAEKVQLVEAADTFRSFATAVDQGQYREAAALFEADGRMNDHALSWAKGPEKIEGMLARLGRGESFALKVKPELVQGDEVTLKGQCERSYLARTMAWRPSEFEAVLHRAADGQWKLARLETYDRAQIDGDEGGMTIADNRVLGSP